jgi:hypothetical protein
VLPSQELEPQARATSEISLLDPSFTRSGCSNVDAISPPVINARRSMPSRSVCSLAQDSSSSVTAKIPVVSSVPRALQLLRVHDFALDTETLSNTNTTQRLPLFACDTASGLIASSLMLVALAHAVERWRPFGTTTSRAHRPQEVQSPAGVAVVLDARRTILSIEAICSECARRGLCFLWEARTSVWVSQRDCRLSTFVVSENVTAVTLVLAAAVSGEVACNPQITAVDFPNSGVITSAIAS